MCTGVGKQLLGVTYAATFGIGQTRDNLSQMESDCLRIRRLVDRFVTFKLLEENGIESVDKDCERHNLLY